MHNMHGPEDVIVWEWLDEYHRWKAYSVEVSNYVQECFKNYKTGTGQHTVYPSGLKHAVYEINLTNMSQTRRNTGTVRKIRQKVYDCNKAVGQGRFWSWENDNPLNKFQDYDFEVTEIIEEHYKNSKRLKLKTVDLSTTPCRMPYIIDFKSMTQTRKDTGRVRQIQREKRPQMYRKVKDVGGIMQTSYNKTSGGYSASNGLTTSTSLVSIGAVGGAPIQPVSISPQVSASFTGNTNVFGTPTFINAPSSSIGGSYIPTGHTSTDTGRVTRSSARIASVGAAATLSSTNVSPASTWHPPLSLPPTYDNQSSVAAKKKTTKKKKKIAKIKPRLPALGSISNTGDFGGAKSKNSKTKGTKFDVVVKNYSSVVKKPPKDEDCCICMSELTDMSAHNEQCNAVLKLKCSHLFHQSCLSAMYDSGTQDGSIQCPKCKEIFGVKYGICPAGTMTYNRSPQCLPGYAQCGLIQVTYNIPQGVQGKEHPSPGARYATQGFPRTAYLPDNEEGERILRLLIKAWERRLTFTIGTSVTTGQSNTVVWNEIHHKTEIANRTGHGYPDPNYFSNVTLEMASQGVVESESDSSSSSNSSDDFSMSDEDL